MNAHTVSPRHATRLRYEPLERRDLMAVALTAGQIAAGSIDVRGEEDSFVFSVTRQGMVELQLTSAAIEPGFFADARVVAPSEIFVTSFNANSGSRRFAVNEIGDYSVTIADSDRLQRGRYTLGLEGISPISPQPILLVTGGIVGGSISERIEKDQLTFQAQASEIVELQITSAAIEAGFFAVAEVFTPSGMSLGMFNAHSGARRFRVDETGTYMVMVSDNDQVQTGSYTLGLESLRPKSPNPIPIIKGETASGFISSRIEKDQLTFDAIARDIVELQIASTAVESGFFAVAELIAPSGSSVAIFNANSGARRLTLEETGSYVVMISDNDQVQTDGYTIGLEGIMPISPQPASLVRGGTVNGSIVSRIEKDQFTFQAAPQNVVDLQIASTAVENGFFAIAEVFAPSGASVTTFNANSGVRRVPISETGTYMIMVSDNDQVQAGNYAISMAGSFTSDFNGDSRVGSADLVVWQSHFGAASGATPSKGDADRDADVDGFDFLAWQREVGGGAGVASATSTGLDSASIVATAATSKQSQPHWFTVASAATDTSQQSTPMHRVRPALRSRILDRAFSAWPRYR